MSAHKAIAVLLIAALLLPGTAIACNNNQRVEGKNIMANIEKPLIDINVSAVTETATFALG
jgi:hypothetical protein